MFNKTSADELFRTGLHLLDEANPLGALSFFEKAYALEKSPAIQSYLGYCIAAERGQIAEAIKLCRAAIEEDPDNPKHYLNLARVYLKTKRKDDAIIELRKGLSYGADEEIKRLLDSLGLRKKPVFPFLSRRNLLNKYLGLILRLLRLR